MDDDDDHDNIDLTEDFLLHTLHNDTIEQNTFFEHFQRFLPRQTLIYIQYCLLRIPFLLLYDYLFTEQFSYLFDYFLEYSSKIIDQENQILFKPISYILHSYFFQLLIDINLNFSIPILGLILLIVLLLCSDRRLVIFYSYTLSLLVIYLYYQINRFMDIQINTFVLQFILSAIYIQMLNIRSPVYTYPIQKRLCHIAPILYLVTRYIFPLTYSIYILNIYYLCWILIHLSEALIFQRDMIIHLIHIRILNQLINLYNNFGIQTLFNTLQHRIHVVTLMKIFWLTKIIIIPLGFRAVYTHPFIINTTTIDTTNETILNYNTTLTKTIYFTTLFYGTETIFTIISLACLVSHGMKILAHRLFRFLNLWNEDVEQIGIIIGMMFFLLLFQSNLTRLDLHRRHIPLLKAFSLLIVALCHFLHTILEPQLLKVAMQTMTTRMAFDETNENQEEIEDNENKSSSSYFSRKILRSFHHQHVYTCLSLLFLIILYATFLWRITTFSTWLLAITAFSLELIVRLIASLAQYTLYVLDAHNRLSNVDSFDEYIFRVKAITSCFEFILGVFLLFNGFYILCFEARGALRAFMLAIHAHLNIIKNVRRGWQILRNRKSAWNNVTQLPLATEEQIENYNDICSICHNVLTTGNTCITPCSHLFHQKCLQKVFYATQNCALCSRPIVLEKKDRKE
ncbi:unnamed protein product [Adineta steineri]|uniref:RING-type domain-containing protein n=1 Tax=Adineta steineri TaxID=433720 RepID=A0A819AM63_9BILA|nr:unnamed protein product [Adineta steineri]